MTDALNFTISGTAINKEKARTCIQRRDLSPLGFAPGTPITVRMTDAGIFIAATPHGERKVSKMSDKRRGHEYSTIDLRYDAAQRQRMFKGAERLNVTVNPHFIEITAA